MTETQIPNTPEDGRPLRGSAGLPGGPELAPLWLLAVILALGVLAVGLFTATSLMQRQDDDTPRTAAERALTDAQAAIEADPMDVEARMRLARVYIGMGQTEAAARTLEAAKELAPEDPRLVHLLGLAYLEGGDPDRAIPLFEQAAGTEGGFAEDYAAIWYDIGRARLLQDDLEGAAAAFEQALVYAPQAADVVFDLATVYERLGRVDDAVTAYEGVLRFVPDHEEARNALSRLGSDR